MYMYTHIYIRLAWPLRKDDARKSRSVNDCLMLRPVRLLRVWVSKGLTEADS